MSLRVLAPTQEVGEGLQVLSVLLQQGLEPQERIGARLLFATNLALDQVEELKPKVT